MVDDTLLQFIRHLRDHELRVSTAETLDAMQVTACLGYGDRRLLRDGLASALAKSEDEQRRFRQCFAQFFDFRDASQSDDDISAAAPADSEPRGGEGLAEGEGEGDGQGGNGSGGQGGDGLRAEVMRAAETAQLASLQYPTQRGIYRRRLLDALNDGERRDSISRLAEGSPEDRAESRWLTAQRERQLAMIAELLDRQLLLSNQSSSRALQENLMRNSPLSAMDHYYRDRLPPLIRKLAKKLAAKHRPRLRCAKRGQPDIRRTLHRSVAYDGVPFKRYWRHRRREKSDIFLLCDLSGSVGRWSQVLLLFVQALAEVLPRSRCFVFCGESIEVSDILREHPADEAVALIQQRHGLGSSDYGLALRSFREQIDGDLSRRSTVMILGDGRGNGGDSGIDALRHLYQHSRLLLWLNPEPVARWYTGDSEIRRYQSACHHVAECGSLRQLEYLLDDLLTRLP